MANRIFLTSYFKTKITIKKSFSFLYFTIFHGGKIMSKKEIYHTEKVTGNINARPASSEEVSYRDGYVDGQIREKYKQNQLKNRDNNNATGGLLLGIFLTLAIGLVAGISELPL
ncbi:hypothetical protein CY0110_12907 [Crocosphaera chwakensis CCY0110]|uniref:Uncharacterized protein n=2 Tax=Crocosphaera TaxID=263510 RepID=A3IQW2_9CHRO|nr:hypothetical protein CY0110_12907 [Crocosphaera chwakensis CCY0110]